MRAKLYMGPVKTARAPRFELSRYISVFCSVVFQFSENMQTMLLPLSLQFPALLLFRFQLPACPHYPLAPFSFSFQYVFNSRRH